RSRTVFAAPHVCARTPRTGNFFKNSLSVTVSSVAWARSTPRSSRSGDATDLRNDSCTDRSVPVDGFLDRFCDGCLEAMSASTNLPAFEPFLVWPEGCSAHSNAGATHRSFPPKHTVSQPTRPTARMTGNRFGDREAWSVTAHSIAVTVVPAPRVVWSAIDQEQRRVGQ